MPSVASAFIAFLLVGTLVSTTQGLLCYVCSFRENVDGETNKACVNEPWTIPGSVRNCLPHLRACRITRTDHKDTGRTSSFTRSCSFPGKNSVETNQHFILTHTFCKTNKCNSGDGLYKDKDCQNKRFVAILVDDVPGGAPRIHFLPVSLIFSILVPLTVTTRLL